MHLLITDFGTFIGKKSERLVVKKGGAVVQEIPFHDLEQVTVATAGAAISADAVHECVEAGVMIHFLSGTGQPYALISSPTLTGTVVTRREQLMAIEDERGLTLARVIIDGKIRNQMAILRYFAKHRKEADPKVYEAIYDAIPAMEAIRAELDRFGDEGQTINELRAQLLSVEGRAAARYWELVAVIVPEDVSFDGREHRGTSNPFNAMLNYGYGVLYQQVWGAVLLAGLEPFAGFLHVDRPGKPSLVLDLVEEFRQQAVDRPIIAMVNKGYRPKLEEERLDSESRREVARRVLERLDDEERFEGKKHRLRTIIQMQARHLAMAIRRERPYRAFVGAW